MTPSLPPPGHLGARPPAEAPGSDLLMSKKPAHPDAAARCEHDSTVRAVPTRSPEAVERAVRLFRALGDEPRLRTLDLLTAGEACVSELSAATGERISTVSHRLRLLRAEGLVSRRRDGRHIYYALADRHVLELVENAMQHAGEPAVEPSDDDDDDDE